MHLEKNKIHENVLEDFLFEHVTPFPLSPNSKSNSASKRPTSRTSTNR
jgi:hypothetical protein